MVRQAAAAHPIVEVVVGQGGGRGNLLEAEPPEEAGAVLLNVKLQLQASNNATQERKQAQNVKTQSVSETDTVCGWMQPEEAVDMQLAEPDRCLFG